MDSHEKVPSQQGAGKTSLMQSLKQAPETVAWCLALTPGILLYGYDLVIVGNVSSMPEFQKDFGRHLNTKLIIPSLWLGLWNIANPLGGILGALTAGSIQDRFGRRFSLATASIVSAVGVAVAYTSNLSPEITTRRSIFFLAKLIQGFAVNMLMCTTQTYMSEVLPALLRGPVLALFPVFTMIGQLVGSVVVYVSAGVRGEAGYQRCFASMWAFSALPFLVSCVMPESPIFLLRRGRRDAARRCQRRLVSTDSAAEKTISSLQSSIELEKQHTSSTGTKTPTPTPTPSYIACFQGPKNRRRTSIVLFANLVPALIGLPLLAKASYFMQVVGMAPHTSLVFLQVGIAAGLVANIGGIATVSRFGRVPLTILGFAICAFLWLGMGIAGCFHHRTDPPSTSTSNSPPPNSIIIPYTQTTLILMTITLSLSTWPASYAFGAEASSLHLRAKTQGLGWLVNCTANGVLGLVLPYIFNEDQGALRGKTGFLFSGFCVLGAGVVWGCVPEMRGRSVGEVEGIFERIFEGNGGAMEVERGRRERGLSELIG
ncbi:general substrate transporter [Aspergillus californicus]